MEGFTMDTSDCDYSILHSSNTICGSPYDDYWLSISNSESRREHRMSSVVHSYNFSEWRLCVVVNC